MGLFTRILSLELLQLQYLQIINYSREATNKAKSVENY